MKHALNWFEIPVTDMQRATAFYSQIFGYEMTVEEGMPGFQMAQFPSDGGVTGALIQGEGYTPAQDGALIYLAAGSDLSNVLEKVEDAGGKVLIPKTSIGEHGYFAWFVDPEGNKIGLHSMG